MLDLNFNEPIQNQQAIFNSFRLDKFERKIKNSNIIRQDEIISFFLNQALNYLTKLKNCFYFDMILKIQ